jgi:amino acid transporter
VAVVVSWRFGVSESVDMETRLGSARKLSLVDAVAQSVGFMGPVFSIAFLVPLLVGLNASGNGAGAAAPLAVVLAAVGVLGLGWIVAEYAKRIHAAGSLYDYVTDGLGGRVGAAAGFLYYIGVIVLGAGLVVMIGGTIADSLEAELGSRVLPRTGWMLVVLALIAVVLYYGAAISTRAQLVLAAVSITVVLIFSLSVIVRVGGDNSIATAASPSSSPQGLGGVLFGVLYGVLLFTGFESAANLGEETEHPRRDIPRAVLFAVLFVSGFYVVCTYAQVAGYSFDVNLLAQNAGAPLFGLAAPSSAGGFGSDLVRQLLELVVVLDMLAVAIGIGVAGTRGLFAMGRDHRLPAALGTTGRTGTPLVAGAVVVAANLVAIGVSSFWHGLFAQHGLPHYVAVFSWGSTFGGFALAMIYLLMSVGALRGLRDHPKQWAVRLAVVDGVLVTAAAMFGSVYHVPAPTIWAPISALVLLPVGYGLTYVFTGRAPLVSTFDGVPPSEQGPVKL